jgi:4-aminobutyrate--pyruvate transaminase
MTEVDNPARSRDIDNCIHPCTNLKTHLNKGQLIITGGMGMYVHDEAGKEYIEGLAGLWCTCPG